MKFSVGFSLLLTVLVLGQADVNADNKSSPTTATFRPQRIAYSDLVDDNGSSSSSLLLNALGRVGMISVTNIPGMSDSKHNVLSGIPGCAQESKATQTHTFGDGTVRRTLATHTVPGGVQEIVHDDDEDSTICQEFAKESKSFRLTVAQVTQAFATRLASLLEIHPSPLLSTKKVCFSVFFPR